MEHRAKSIKPFLGAKDFQESRAFYNDLGFKEIVLSSAMSFFHTNGLGFYLQNAYVKDWVDNTMVFMEVENVNEFWADLSALELPTKFKSSKVLPVRELDWGKECFVHDPSGNLWHFGEFKSE